MFLFGILEKLHERRNPTVFVFRFVMMVRKGEAERTLHGETLPALLFNSLKTVKIAKPPQMTHWRAIPNPFVNQGNPDH